MFSFRGSLHAANGRKQRIRPVPARSGGGRLTERAPAVQPRAAGTSQSAPKATLARAPRVYRAAGQQSFDRAASSLSHPVTTAKTGRPHRAVVHDPDANTYDAASTIVAPKVRGSRTVNSVNSPIWLSTLIVPPCAWVTMS